MRSQFEREGPAHIDMSMGDWRDLSQELVRKLLRRLPREGLHLLGIPGHDDVGQQRQRTGNRGQLLARAAAPGADAAGVDGPFQAVHRLTLIEQVEDFGPSTRSVDFRPNFRT